MKVGLNLWRKGRIIPSPISGLPLEARLAQKAVFMPLPWGEQIEVTLTCLESGGGWVEGGGTEMSLFPLLQVPSSSRVPVVWAPEGRGEAGWGVQPSQESWKHSRKYLCSRRGRPEALGLNRSALPNLASAGIISLLSSPPRKLLEGEP